jgi:hypothetical protein
MPYQFIGYDLKAQTGFSPTHSVLPIGWPSLIGRGFLQKKVLDIGSTNVSSAAFFFAKMPLTLVEFAFPSTVIL